MKHIEMKHIKVKLYNLQQHDHIKMTKHQASFDLPFFLREGGGGVVLDTLYDYRVDLFIIYFNNEYLLVHMTIIHVSLIIINLQYQYILLFSQVNSLVCLVFYLFRYVGYQLIEDSQGMYRSFFRQLDARKTIDDFMPIYVSIQ